MAPRSELVTIHYHRLPDRDQKFIQELIYSGDDVVVTFLPATPLHRPLMIDGRVVLEDGSPVVWFTFPGRSHDIGRFHTRGGEFTGVYANILTPVHMITPAEWQTTDLFLDLWLDNGKLHMRDEVELAAAIEHGWISEARARAAYSEAHLLQLLHAAGAWPPPIVEQWPLARVLAARRRR